MLNIRFSPEVNNILNYSRQEALRLSNSKITPTHLLLGILRHGRGFAVEVLQKLNADLQRLKVELERAARSEVAALPFSAEELTLDIAANRIMQLSVIESRIRQSDTINVEHILLAILKDDRTAASQTLGRQHITYAHYADLAYANNVATGPRPSANGKNIVRSGFGFPEKDEDDEEDPALGTAGTRTKPNDGKENASSTPVLDNFGTDLTRAAADGLLDPVIGRKAEIERVAQILVRRKKNNPILIGEPGVGKSAIVEGLAMRIVQRKIARILWNKRVVVLDMGSVVAGTKYRGQFEERIRAIVAELKENPDVIIFIDEVHTLIGAGSAPGSMDAANLLKPALARGEIQCIGATTINEYRKTIEKDGALERRFQKVLVNPTTAGETLDILRNLQSRYEEHHNVSYTDDALEACVRLTERYVSDRSFPDKAIDALDESGARAHIMDVPVSPDLENMEREVARLNEQKDEAIRTQNYELAADYRDQLKTAQKALDFQRKEWEKHLKDNPQVVDAQQVAQVVSKMTGIPVERLGEEEHERLRHLGDRLKEKVVGQDAAIEALTRAIQRSRIGLKDPRRPIGAFMLVGPTGVGKTYLTEMLAEEMFGKRESLIRIDMSEYMEKHTVSRMIGSPPGYVGYDEGGQLTEKVRRNPYSIILFDEIEKAHRDVFNLLLQVMDEGRLTDGNGATIDFRNTILVMTSNSGTRQLKEFGNGVGFSASQDVTHDRQLARSIVEKSLQRQFAPEFLNRLSDIIYFDQLSPESILKIVDIELAPLMRRVEDMGFSLKVTDAAKQLLAKKGYDVQYGARPLKRTIQNLLEDPLCQRLLDGAAEGTAFEADAEGEEIVIRM
ncbi:MAG: ATP-dependent Clp protease ATP-binding subunit [Prevotellaceae bacterium]|nr:ATP-dependent Clp protease ATP-binding subunit [Prevotellaceae bacterium]